jgi:anhydro-N-acetylmuramic acid kinase
MSGTSADSIDAAIVNLGTKTPKLIATHSIDLAATHPELKAEIHALAIPGANELHRMNQLDRALGLLFAQVTNELLEQQQLHASDILAIGSHGQTIRHHPTTNDGDFAYTVQIGDPNTIAQLTGITTVADFRRRDIALGGQGAPLVPAFHQTAFEKAGTCRAIVNIGGMANITLLSGHQHPDEISNLSLLLGYDTGPGNGLMDKWIKQHQGKNYDDRGQWASQGHVNSGLLSTLMNTAYLFQPPPKSTGPELFNEQWLSRQIREHSEITPVDVQATLLEFTARTIADALKSHTPNPTEIYFCGGGTYNTALIQRLETLLHPRLIASTDQLGISPGWVEAAAFAWLAKQTLNGKPGNAPSVTGAEKASILGAIFPAP